jgi:hypothetical protein
MVHSNYLHNVKLFLEYLEGVGIEAIGEVDRVLIADYQIRLSVPLTSVPGKPLPQPASTGPESLVSGGRNPLTESKYKPLLSIFKGMTFGLQVV